MESKRFYPLSESGTGTLEPKYKARILQACYLEQLWKFVFRGTNKTIIEYVDDDYPHLNGGQTWHLIVKYYFLIKFGAELKCSHFNEE